MFECEHINAYDIEVQNGMTRMNDNKGSNISECYLLHDILNPLKRTKHLNIHYYPILRGYMNTRKGKAKFKNFLILLDNGCSSSI